MKKNKTKQQKSNQRIDKYFIKTTQPQEVIEQASIQSSKSCKRVIISKQIDLTADKQQTVSIHKKQALNSIIKNIQMLQILQKCPNIKLFIDSLKIKINLDRNQIINIFKKYLQSSYSSLWSLKYAPKNCYQLFNTQAGQQIKLWLQAFFQYKNKIRQQSESFINDFTPDNDSCTIFKNIMKNRWKLSALVIVDRPGIGKTSAIRAVTKQMGIDIQQCGNHYNQTKYLKEKNQSTQSQSVKTAISKKIKHQKNSQMITKFLPLIQKQKNLQAKKAQIIHNVGLIYPETESNKFYSQLSRCIELSKIPFIMTNSTDKLPRECQKYDIIQFQHGQTNKIQHTLWGIYHIQKLCTLNTSQLIDSSQIFQQMNIQSNKLQFKQIISMNKIKQLCYLYNYNFDYIFTALQYQQGISKANLHQLFLQKAKKYNQNSFLNDIDQDIHQKMIDIDNTNDTQQTTKENDMKSIVDKLNFNKYQDLIQQIEPSNSELKEYIKKLQYQDDLSICINPKIHSKIKNKLVKKINDEISSYQKFRSTLKAKQLMYLPMLTKQKRNSRSLKGLQQSYMKYFDENETKYIKRYGNLIKQS